MQRIFFSMSLLFLFSCKGKIIDSGPAIVGLASPFQLKGDTTEFYLSDYVPEIKKVDSVFFPEGTFPIKLNDSLYSLVKSDKMKPFSVISLLTNSGREYIPVINRKKQRIVIQYKGPGKYKNLKVIGSMNNWDRKNEGMKNVNGTWKQEFSVEPGIYEYLFYSEGKEFRDPSNKLSMGNNSVIKVGEYLPENLPFAETDIYDKVSVTLNVNKQTTGLYAFWQNKLIDVKYTDGHYTIYIPAIAAGYERSYIRVFPYNGKNVGNDVLIPLKYGKVITDSRLLTRNDKQAMVMYFLMVDRFYNGDSLNDEPVDDPEILPKANYFGGDLAGVYQKIQEGYFSDLGINTIWISPIFQNPKGAYGLYSQPRTKFSGYHGYWPVSNIKIDYRFGQKEDLSQIVKMAHQKQMNVLLDYVANHVHRNHPVYLEHPDWATNLYLPDSSLNTERWDEYRLTTWFDTFLPTLDLRRKDVVDAMVDSAIYWIKEYHIDGFRHDATKHIDELYWRALTGKIKQLTGSASFFQIGETYGSPALISSYIGSGMLDAQFDFNTYDNAVACFALENESFERLKTVLSNSWKYYGYHHLMGNITGNQDRARFISYAGGDVSFSEDTKYAGWNREIGVGNPESYKKLKMLHAFNMTIPGIPVVYYGDEIGMPGGDDPDNRRMMRFSGLNENEKDILKTVKNLINLRKSNIALLFGQTKILQADNEVFAFTRIYFNQKILVVFNKSTSEKNISFALNPATDKPWAEFGSIVNFREQNLEIEIGPLSFEIIHY